MKFSDIAVLILAAVMLLSVLYSCGKDAGGAPDSDTQAAQENAADGGAADAETTRAPSGVGEGLDFGGAEFKQLYPEWQGYRHYFFADEENGDVMNDAIYLRKIRVEEELNVVITSFNVGREDTLPPALIKTVNAGEDAYQQVFLHCIYGVSQLSSGGYLFNVDNLPYISLDSDWWN